MVMAMVVVAKVTVGGDVVVVDGDALRSVVLPSCIGLFSMLVIGVVVVVSVVVEGLVKFDPRSCWHLCCSTVLYTCEPTPITNLVHSSIPK